MAKQWPVSVHTRVHHQWTHIDERAADYDARRAGERVFPGIRTSKVMLTNAGEFTPDGRPVQEWEAQGYLPFGVWHGLLDEHGLSQEAQNAGASTATLTATMTGSCDDPAWQPILKYVSHNDSAGQALPWDLAQLVKDVNDHLDNQGRVAALNRKSFDLEMQWREAQWMIDMIFHAQITKNLGLLTYETDPANPWQSPAEWVALWLVDRFGKDAHRLTRKFWRGWKGRSGSFEPIGRKPGSNVAFTMAEELGLMKDLDGHLHRQVSRTLEFADRKGATAWDAATLVRDCDAHLRYKKFSGPDRFERMKRLAWLILDAKRSGQAEFMRAEAQVGDQKKFIFLEVPGKGRRGLLCTVLVNSRQGHKVARAQRPRPDVVISQYEGKIFVGGSPSYPMAGAHVRLIEEEMRYGHVSEAEARRRWKHFVRSTADWLINGGLSAPHVAPTAIPVWLIQKIVYQEMKKATPVVQIERRDRRDRRERRQDPQQQDQQQE
jgi:hypothetical protein